MSYRFGRVDMPKGKKKKAIFLFLSINIIVFIMLLDYNRNFKISGCCFGQWEEWECVGKVSQFWTICIKNYSQFCYLCVKWPPVGKVECFVSMYKMWVSVLKANKRDYTTFCISQGSAQRSLSKAKRQVFQGSPTRRSRSRSNLNLCCVILILN